MSAHGHRDADAVDTPAQNSTVNQGLEAQRQQALLAALWAPADGAALSMLHETGARAAQGLSAYKANAEALAERALAAVFATVQAMVGELDFKHLAREFWRAHPPQRGDMGEWGGEFPAWLQAHPAFTEWPYLGDSARLDLALHQCERAADATLDASSLGLLESVDPEQLRIALMPGLACLASPWPIGTIYRAHLQARPDAQPPPDATADDAGADTPSATATTHPDFATVRAALAAQRGEHVLVARAGWRAHVHTVDAPTLAWTALLLAGTPLNAALEQCGEGFDFGAWLATALREGWVKELTRTHD